MVQVLGIPRWCTRTTRCWCLWRCRIVPGGNEKWVFYRSANREMVLMIKIAAQPTTVQVVAKQDSFPQKVMLCVWWNFGGIINHFALFKVIHWTNHSTVNKCMIALTPFSRLVVNEQTWSNESMHFCKVIMFRRHTLMLSSYVIQLIPIPWLHSSLPSLQILRFFGSRRKRVSGDFASKPSTEWYLRTTEELTQRWMIVI